MPLITETTLELHFHSTLMGLVRGSVGQGGVVASFHRYSPRHEAFLGFDHSFVLSELPKSEVVGELRARLAEPDAGGDLFVGYFLQFKVVQRLERRSKFTPRPFGLPYYRVALATQPTKTRDLSEHELLWRLAREPGAIACYACPMVFDHAELYRPEADLGLLRLVDVSSAPEALVGGSGHSICFQAPGSGPLWFRPPEAALGASPGEFVGRLLATARDPALRRANNALLLSVIDDPPAHGFRSSRRRLRALADSLTILRIRGSAPIEIPAQPG